MVRGASSGMSSIARIYWIYASGPVEPLGAGEPHHVQPDGVASRQAARSARQEIERRRRDSNLMPRCGSAAQIRAYCRLDGTCHMCRWLYSRDASPCMERSPS